LVSLFFNYPLINTKQNSFKKRIEAAEKVPDIASRKQMWNITKKL
jgi:hypothetical protein